MTGIPDVRGLPGEAAAQRLQAAGISFQITATGLPGEKELPGEKSKVQRTRRVLAQRRQPDGSLVLIVAREMDFAELY